MYLTAICIAASNVQRDAYDTWYNFKSREWHVYGIHLPEECCYNECRELSLSHNTFSFFICFNRHYPSLSAIQYFIPKWHRNAKMINMHERHILTLDVYRRNYYILWVAFELLVRGSRMLAPSFIPPWCCNTLARVSLAIPPSFRTPFFLFPPLFFLWDNSRTYASPSSREHSWEKNVSKLAKALWCLGSERKVLFCIILKDSGAYRQPLPSVVLCVYPISETIP